MWDEDGSLTTILIWNALERSTEPVVTQGRVTRGLTKAMKKRSRIPFLGHLCGLNCPYRFPGVWLDLCIHIPGWK